MFSRTAPNEHPGDDLVAVGNADKPVETMAAHTIVSTESATISREGSEYFMPVWPIATPSQSAIVLNSKGTPPASRMASAATVRATSLRWTVAWHDLGEAVGDADKRLVKVPILQTARVQQTAMGGSLKTFLDGVTSHICDSLTRKTIDKCQTLSLATPGGGIKEKPRPAGTGWLSEWQPQLRRSWGWFQAEVPLHSHAPSAPPSPSLRFATA